MKRSLLPFFITLSMFAACAPAPVGKNTDPPDGAPVEAGPFVPDQCKASLSQKSEVVVGQGQTFYTPIDDNAMLTWEKGPQGGHHIWVAIRMIGIHMQGTITTVDVEDIEDATKPILINHSRLIFDFTREEGGHCVLSGLRMQIDNAGSVPLASLMNHHLRVTVGLKDADGSVATGTRVVIVSGDLK